jgi:hypothetical protein
MEAPLSVILGPIRLIINTTVFFCEALIYGETRRKPHV